jgi:hypothetical protein
MLRLLGAQVADPEPVHFLGLPNLELWPRVTWSPLFACTFDDLQVRNLTQSLLPARHPCLPSFTSRDLQHSHAMVIFLLLGAFDECCRARLHRHDPDAATLSCRRAALHPPP